MRYKTYKKYAGVVKKGTVPMVLDSNRNQNHLMRASWLTAQVEVGGMYGAVQNYDGTGMTAGIHQAVAVYPKSLEQGPLFSLLASILHSGIPGLGDMVSAMLDDVGFTVSPEGRLRYTTSGLLVPATHIREDFTGSKCGKMPKKGYARLRAEAYVREFSELFADERTYALQEMYGVKQFILFGENARLQFSKDLLDQKHTIQSIVYSPYKAHLSTFDVEASGIPEDLELAMCVFWSYSVNAPSKALKLLSSVYTKTESLETFPKDLIKALGTSRYGRWSYKIANGRYQRTRNAARKLSYNSKLFSRKGGIMPKVLK